MTAATQHIAVLYGGTSAEREVSLASGKAIASGLTHAGYQVTLFDTKERDIEELKQLSVDKVFIALHGRGGEDGCLQGALEFIGIPYTGSGVLGSALAMDKVRTKLVLQALGLPTAKFSIVNLAQFNRGDSAQIIDALGGKAMVKPANEGSSIGMAKVTSADELNIALENAFNFDDQVLVEAWIEGPEYTVAVLGEEVLPAIHMETPRDFYDYEAKYKSTTTQYHCPCGLTEADESELKVLAAKAFDAVGAKGWGRVDIMRSEAGQWQILEVNTVPGMTETSLVPKAAKVFGLSFSELVSQIVEMAEPLDSDGR